MGEGRGDLGLTSRRRWGPDGDGLDHHLRHPPDQARAFAALEPRGAAAGPVACPGVEGIGGAPGRGGRGVTGGEGRAPRHSEAGLEGGRRNRVPLKPKGGGRSGAVLPQCSGHSAREVKLETNVMCGAGPGRGGRVGPERSGRNQRDGSRMPPERPRKTPSPKSPTRTRTRGRPERNGRRRRLHEPAPKVGKTSQLVLVSDRAPSSPGRVPAPGG